jgi:hypothetical protein
MRRPPLTPALRLLRIPTDRMPRTPAGVHDDGVIASDLPLDRARDVS